MSINLPSPARVGSALSHPTDTVQWFRGQLACQMTEMISGERMPEAGPRSSTASEDPGWFGPESVTWRLHADACMLAGGLRALMLQTMHPLAMAGVAQHSNFRDDPLSRLASTSMYVGTSIYGSKDEVVQAIARVKRVHGSVRGTAPDGRRYDANDPHLLTWVHHTLVDSFLRAYQRYGNGPLSPADADRYVEEQAVLADLFEAEPAARSVAQLRTYFHDIRPELHATSEARQTIRFLLAPPLPLAARGPYVVLASASITMLPRWLRRELRLPVAPAFEPLIARPVATALLRSIDWVLEGHPSLTAHASLARTAN